MNSLGSRKWMMGCIAMAMALIILSGNSIALYKQVDALEKEVVGHITSEWYQLYRLSEMVDKYYIRNNYEDPRRYQLFVNQTAHHFEGRADDLSVHMRNLLVLAYDPLFADLSLENGPSNKEEASTLLRAMNDDIMMISRGIVDMQDHEKEKLLDPASSEYMKVSTQVKDASEKYIQLVDDYFKNNSREQ